MEDSFSKSWRNKSLEEEEEEVEKEPICDLNLVGLLQTIALETVTETGVRGKGEALEAK